MHAVLSAGPKKYDHISPLLKELNWLLEGPFWHLNVLILPNNLTSLGEKLETNNRHIFPHLNRRVAREASISEQ